MLSIRRRRSDVAEKPDFNEIVILATPRSGSNFFCECLGGMPGVAGFYELFNRQGAYGLGSRIVPVVGTRLGLPDVETAKDPRLVSIFRQTPLKALEALANAAREQDKSAMSYKIFPRQLSMDTMGQILDSNQRHPLFLVRRRIDVYISLQKATRSDSWTQSSTVDVRPELEVDDFLEWAAQTDEWYAAAFKLAQERSQQILVANYESDVDVPKGELTERLHGALQAYGINTTPAVDVKRVRFKRQDRRGHPFKKIANGDAFRAGLRSAGQLRYALGTPLENERLAYPFLRDRPVHELGGNALTNRT